MHDILTTLFSGLFVQEKKKECLNFGGQRNLKISSYLLQSRLVTNL